MSENPRVKCTQLHYTVGVAPSPVTTHSDQAVAGVGGDGEGGEGPVPMQGCRVVSRAAACTASARAHGALPLRQAMLNVQRTIVTVRTLLHMIRTWRGVKVPGRASGHATRYPASATQRRQGHEKQGRLRNSQTKGHKEDVTTKCKSGTYDWMPGQEATLKES